MGSTRGTSASRRSRPGIAGLAGAALLVASGAIHLDLYLTGYRSIPTIGWLFLLQVIAAFALAAAIALTGSPLAAAAGAGFAISTLGGYLLSLWVGLFGFTEVRTTAGIVAGIIDVAAFAALAIAAAPALPQTRDACRRLLAAVGCRLSRRARAAHRRGRHAQIPAGRGLPGCAEGPRRRRRDRCSPTPTGSRCTRSPRTPRPSPPATAAAPPTGRRSPGPRPPGPGSTGSWARSAAPTARPRPLTTATRSTPTSATARPARTAGTTST